MSEFKVDEELKKLPHEPGVYIMHDEQDTVLYVGKAKDLHNRVRSYFRKIVGRGPQIAKMVSLIDYFEYIVTDSEVEALVLENNLIKEHSPKYNTMLKDGKTYPYIKVTLSEEFPRIILSRQMKKDKAKYFGPYPTGVAVKETIELVNKLFMLKTCNKALLPKEIGKERPCLNYHINQCSAPCIGKVSKEEYNERVLEAIDFLNGNYKDTLVKFEQKMKQLSEELRFEEAAKVRDMYNSIKALSERQKITAYDEEDKDIVALARNESDAVVQVFFVRNGRMIGREHFHMTDILDVSNSEILLNFVKQYYSGTPFIPRELLIEEDIEDREIIEQWLSMKRESRMYINIPKIGQKEKLVELAKKNAQMILSKDMEEIKKKKARTTGAVKEIEEKLGLTGLTRMEAFDISNIGGFLNVASMVVFENGSPKKTDYRKFRMKTVEGPDDYACMKEVLTRRFTHGLEEKEELKQKELSEKYGSFTKFPDLILMDGGRGQVNIALKVLEELRLNIPVCGMVKDDNHNTRGLYYQNIEIPIDRRSEGFKLITRIQDEAHRFAIEYHRSLRNKNEVKSILDDIPGVGPSRRKALMRSFDSIDEVKEASVERLMGVDGITRNVAEGIYSFFHKES
ncbi:MAG: excinuclease ABC subunit UvrC [Lachnospiraceae bacterium]|nr:excinuclease ABC subunit UvrC [Lachnospiraceae bacterium]